MPMSTLTRKLAALALVATLACANAQGRDEVIVFAVSNANTMPLAQFVHGNLESGILKDLGEAIGARVQRKARFVATPRKRLELVLHDGTVDGVCYMRPAWLAGDLNWSAPLIPNENLLVAGVNLDAPRELGELSGETLALVLGYSYPELDAALGTHYLRDDAPTMPANIDKLLAGRRRYAVLDHLSVAYQAKSQPALAKLASLTISSFTTHCAFSPASKIPFETVDAAIRQLLQDGSVQRILLRYR